MQMASVATSSVVVVGWHGVTLVNRLGFHGLSVIDAWRSVARYHYLKLFCCGFPTPTSQVLLPNVRARSIGPELHKHMALVVVIDCRALLACAAGFKLRPGSRLIGVRLVALTDLLRNGVQV